MSKVVVQSNRDAAKDRRRGQILIAAERLVRASGTTDFSMKELAAAADLSFATPFNLFGNKFSIVAALLSQAFEQMEQLQGDWQTLPPLQRLLTCPDLSVDYFIADAHYFRAILGTVTSSKGQSGPANLSRATQFWYQELQAAQQHKLLNTQRDYRLLAYQLELNWLGSLHIWLALEDSDEQWRWQVRYSTWLALQTVLKRPHLSVLNENLLTAEAQLSSTIP